ncbi:MAG: long-chain fatty acid--CoA ligase [Rhodoferax sp.]|uniref:class I adenylate-forming enzyme family protein n=1 Tax=Rhodoferax sp. TaxID=50421 RepID=UPI002620E7CE|nr:long-chain fatty acid--CoA ligase [Rhodoferax sp.]MDD5335504.1 long-chain fatty acid--CoA ligase [Rhodoferax sp.]
MNIADYLEQHAAQTPERIAIRFEGRSITYGQLNRDANRLAASLRAAGVAVADRVALYLPNVPEFAVAYYAAQKLGAIPVTINAILKTEEVRYLLDDSGAAVVITMDELKRYVPDDCAALRLRVVVDPKAELTGWVALAQLLQRGADTFASVQRSGDDVAALLYSSGTTGFPKGVALTQHNIHSNIALPPQARYSDYRPGDRLAAFLPLFHVYGQNYIMNAAILAGATIVLFPRFVPDVVLRAIGEERITHFFAVPTIFINLLAMDLSGYDLSSLRYEMSAAATMPEEISRRWTERFGRRVYEGYGLTECSPFSCYNDVKEHRFGSVGRAIEGFELKIFDESDHEVAAGVQGEIVIRGDGVMQGYWRRPEETATALRGGWLHTGDVGRMDQDGYVYITDRVKDMINVSGFKVWPAEVEQYLYKVPGIQEVAVYGIPAAAQGEKVAVAVVLKPGATLSADGIIAYCREHIAAYKVPARVDIVSELPKSASGKILKRVLRQQSAT